MWNAVVLASFKLHSKKSVTLSVFPPTTFSQVPPGYSECLFVCFRGLELDSEASNLVLIVFYIKDILNWTRMIRYVMDVDIIDVRVPLVILNIPHPDKGSAESRVSRIIFALLMSLLSLSSSSNSSKLPLIFLKLL